MWGVLGWSVPAGALPVRPCDGELGYSGVSGYGVRPPQVTRATALQTRGRSCSCSSMTRRAMRPKAGRTCVASSDWSWSGSHSRSWSISQSRHASARRDILGDHRTGVNIQPNSRTLIQHPAPPAPAAPPDSTSDGRWRPASMCQRGAGWSPTRRDHTAHWCSIDVSEPLIGCSSGMVRAHPLVPAGPSPTSLDLEGPMPVLRGPAAQDTPTGYRAMRQ